jgi:hypothetical protein
MSSVGAILGTAAVTIGRGAAAAVGDGLSFASELLRAVGGEQAAETTPANSENALSVQMAAMRARIQRFLAEAGIVLKQPVTLASDGLGGIAVAGNHPQREAIERALGSEVLLERDFQQLASDSATGEQFTIEIGPGVSHAP